LFREPDFATSTAYFICRILIKIHPSVVSYKYYNMFFAVLQYYFFTLSSSSPDISTGILTLYYRYIYDRYTILRIPLITIPYSRFTVCTIWHIKLCLCGISSKI
jgi:hypothetical protein